MHQSSSRMSLVDVKTVTIDDAYSIQERGEIDTKSISNASYADHQNSVVNIEVDSQLHSAERGNGIVPFIRIGILKNTGRTGETSPSRAIQAR